jgi:uncharacterized protein Veg
MGGKFLLKLNTGERPIANKYREGKMRRSLERVFIIELEIAKKESLKTRTYQFTCESLGRAVA